MQIADCCRSRLRFRRGLFRALLFGALLPAVGLWRAEAQAEVKPGKAAGKSALQKAASRKAASAKAQAAPTAVPAVAPAASAAPEAPRWPASEKPASATIRWDSRGLRIEAANSSMQQILKEVTALTGIAIEGMNKDQRVFGSYGPGMARDVLSEFLRGTGYNVLMIGEQGGGTPRQIVLTQPEDGKGASRTASGAPAHGDDADEDDASEEPAPQPPSAERSPVPNGVMPQRGMPGQPPDGRGRPN